MHANREERHGRYNSWLEEQYDYLTEAHKPAGNALETGWSLHSKSIVEL